VIHGSLRKLVAHIRENLVDVDLMGPVKRAARAALGDLLSGEFQERMRAQGVETSVQKVRVEQDGVYVELLAVLGDDREVYVVKFAHPDVRPGEGKAGRRWRW
jgi:hypothetical protein